MGTPVTVHDITDVIVELTEAGGKTRMVMARVAVAAGTAGEGGWN